MYFIHNHLLYSNSSQIDIFPFPSYYVPNLWYSNILVFLTCNWYMVDLSGTTLLEKTDTCFQQLKVAVISLAKNRASCSNPISKLGFGQVWSYFHTTVDSYLHLSCVQNRAFPCYSLLHSLIFFLLPLLQWTQSLWRRGCEIQVPHRAENSEFFLFYELYKVASLCDDHHLLQTEVSGMRVKLCFNVWHRLRYY